MREMTEIRKKWKSIDLEGAEDYDQGYNDALFKVVENVITFEESAIKEERKTLECTPEHKSETWLLGYMTALDWVLQVEKK